MPEPQRPIVEHAAERTAELLQRLASLSFSFRCNQVRHRFGLGQRHAAVEKRAAGELPGLGRAQALRHQCGGHAVQHRGAGMKVQLCAILAGVARRPGHPQYQSLVQHCSTRVGEPPEAGPSWWRQAAPGDRPQCLFGPRTGEPHHGDCRAPGAGRHGEDGVFGAHHIHGLCTPLLWRLINSAPWRIARRTYVATKVAARPFVVHRPGRVAAAQPDIGVQSWSAL